MDFLRTGRRTLPLPPPLMGLVALARPEPPPLADPSTALRDALCAPVSGPPLAELARGARVVLVLPDGTRPLPVALVETVIEELGASLLEVRVANGTHRRTGAEEHRRLLGRFFGKIAVGDRDCENAAAHRQCGPARLDARALDADALVLMGPASFHYLAGFGSGGKLLAPGLADLATARWVHSACLAPEGGRHPLARAGVRENNPLRERIEAICHKAPPQLYVIPVLDSSGGPVRIIAGERGAAFAQSCQALEDGYSATCTLHQTVIASSGGHPYDVDFVQGHKALEAAAAACRPGGTIVWISDCSEGMPARHRAFLEKHPTAAAMEAALRHSFDIAAHTVWAAREKAERFRIRAVTSLPAELVRALGMEPCASIDEALEGCELTDAAILPAGARFLPRPSR